MTATFILAHGAGAGPSSPWMKRYKRGLEARGMRVVTFEFPKTRSNMTKLEDAYRAVIDETPGRPLVIGGKSMGGRVASLIAAKYTLPIRGLVFFGYPLHPPGKPEKRRDAHLPDVKHPMLFVSGARDPFGSDKEIRALAKKLGSEVLVVPGGNHSIEVPKRWAVAGSAAGGTAQTPTTQGDVDARVWDAAAAFVRQLK
jgi:predicted alpha/beta-hydrolase family hydrolase